MMYTSKADEMALIGLIGPNTACIFIIATGQGVPHALIYLNIYVFSM